jgi:hypothetical protein
VPNKNGGLVTNAAKVIKKSFLSLMQFSALQKVGKTDSTHQPAGVQEVDLRIPNTLTLHWSL